MIENGLLSLHHFSRLVPGNNFSRLRLHLFYLFFVRFFILSSLLGIIGGRNLKDRVYKKAEVRLFVANSEMEILINFIESLWVYPFSEIGMFLCPVLEDEFEIWANSYCFF